MEFFYGYAIGLISGIVIAVGAGFIVVCVVWGEIKFKRMKSGFDEKQFSMKSGFDEKGFWMKSSFR